MASVKINEQAMRYNFGNYPLAIHVLEMYKQGYQVPPHWHEGLEYVVPISGTAVVTVGTAQRTLHHNLGILINVNRVHALQTNSGSDGRLLIVQVQPDMLLNRADSQLALRLSDMADDFLLLDAASSWQDTVLKQLSRLGNYYRFGGADPLTAYMECLAMAARCLPHFRIAGDGRGNDRVQFAQMCSYIEENYPDELSIAAIARSGGVGRSHCFAIFAGYAAQTPTDYVQSCRLRHAKTLLATSNLDVAEVALRSGYKSASYFSMQFKRQNAMTPRDYRRTVRTISN